MAANLRQDPRIGSFDTPLGKDKLVLYRFDGSEGLSELFEFRIEALSESDDVNFDSAIGANCCVSIKNPEGTPRYFNGTLVETQWLGIRDNYYAYSLILRPWLWMLSCVSDCKIFSQKDIPTIIKEIFGKHGFAKYESKLQQSYPTLEYCVQYRETDLNFVCRLMEEAGIHYFFEHSEGEHKMVLADSPSCHKPKEGGAKLVYRRAEKSLRREENLYHWFPARRFNSGKVTLNDYDYLKPSASLLSEKEGGGSYQNASLEVYDYPGRFTDKGVGQDYAKVRLEAAQSTDHRYHAVGDAVTCCPGATISLEEHPDSSQNRDYLIVKAVHAFVSDLYRSASGDSDKLYEGRYDYLEGDIPFRAPQVTLKPRIHGLQTAKVAGDGEIDVDKYGRIIVHFFWDREQKDSRRVRIAQIWSDKNWGGIVIPRVGQEVIVQYAEGDPDQPLVVGTVYNAEKMPPYTLPDEKTVAGVRSRSTTNGGEDCYNEFIFDDKTGSELIRMHGQKDLEGKIENDERWTIGNDRTEKIGQVWKVEAGTKIEFIVATSKITMEPQGITIQAPMITIKADALINASAPITQVSGSGVLILQGGIVMIN